MCIRDSGKSTFLRCLGQLETIDGGSITVDGTVLASTDANGKMCIRDSHLVVCYLEQMVQLELVL